MLTWPNKGHWKWDFSMDLLAKEQIMINDQSAICFEDLIVGRWVMPLHARPHLCGIACLTRKLRPEKRTSFFLM